MDYLLLHLRGCESPEIISKWKARIGMASVVMSDAQTLEAFFQRVGSGLVHPCKRLLKPPLGSWRISKPRKLADSKILHWPNIPKKKFWTMLVFNWGSRVVDLWVNQILTVKRTPNGSRTGRGLLLPVCLFAYLAHQLHDQRHTTRG
ncbi:hypothetical protein B5807_10871 [Epicoccum nigrum]|jgi:hypothetical protein|uniref:Uncharacterized protein n=1 Tax=Epicoccum nigrum TaxID=105696 RepID=A0A1Y2LKU7_EPING|nr:hypothetical protein B5807_10871 [Epicoccum nigrum]